MHYAYPRECSYPHAAGTTSPQLQEDFVNNTGLLWSVSEDVAYRYAQDYVKGAIYSHPWPRHDDGMVDNTMEACRMWTMDEELVVMRPASATSGPAPLWK